MWPKPCLVIEEDAERRRRWGPLWRRQEYRQFFSRLRGQLRLILPGW